MSTGSVPRPEPLDATAERARLAALSRYEILDTPTEEAFEDLCGLAAEICGTPIAMVSLIDEGRQWFKAKLGVDTCSTDRDQAFCAHALASPQVMVVPDATADSRFVDNPLVTGEPNIRFYAGAPLITSENHILGTLCVIDTEPRELSARQLDLLQRLSRQVMTQLDHRLQARDLALEAKARSEAESALAETRRVLDGVLENTDVVVYAKDLDGRFLIANPALHALIGRPAGDVVGHTDTDLFGVADGEVFARNDRAVAAGGTRLVIPEKLTLPDGSVRSYLSTKFPLRNDDGEVYAIAGVSTDVTEIERANSAMAESTQRWQALVENSPVAVAVYAADDLCFRYANDPAARLYGAASSDDLIGCNSLDVFTGAHRASYLQGHGRVLAGETLLGTQTHIVGFDGLARDVEVNASPVTWQGERAVQVEMRDITARVAIDTALRASEERFRVLFDTAPVGMVEALPDGTLLAVNPQLCALLGYAAHELIGLPISMVTDAAVHAEMIRAVAALDTTGKPGSYSRQQTYRRKDGTAVAVVVSISPIRDADGQNLRVVASFLDVSDRVAVEERLRETAARLAERQAFSDALLDTVEVGIVACDGEGRLTRFNTAAKTWHGLDADAALDPSELSRHYDLYEADGVTLLAPERTPLLIALRSGCVVESEIVIAPHGLPAIRVLCTGRIIHDESGGGQGAVVAMQDITVLRAREEQLREHAAFHDAVLAASPDLIYLLEPEANRVTWSSGDLLEILGYEADQIEAFGPQEYTSFIHPDDLPRLLSANEASRAMADGQVLHLRYRAKAFDGQYRWLSRRATPFRRSAAGEVTELLAVARDITEIVEIEERLTVAALHDPLTGLPNRTLLADRLGLALRRTARTQEKVAILFCDLDGFKKVNDTAGHAAGDVVLMSAATRLRGVLRPQDTVARVGGDEFVILLEPSLPDDSAGDVDRTEDRLDPVTVAWRIKHALAEPVMVDGAEYVVTASIGMTFAQDGDDPEEALRDADSAMYRAKTRGKNRHELFQTSLRADALERGRAEHVLRDALHHLPPVVGPAPAELTGRRPAGSGSSKGRESRLSLAYQPIVDLPTQRMVGVEALARLHDADGAPIGPDVFIPIAEETGLIGELGRFVLETACHELAGWHARHPAYQQLGMSVNLSARQAGLADLVQQVQDTLLDTGLDAGCLTLELTETVLLEAGRSTARALRDLRGHGVNISIDDFGTGYASLRYLTELPVTGVKVDQSFTQGLRRDPASTAIVSIVTTLAEQLGLSCVVEGIETRDQLSALPPGVLGQGYLLGRPQSPKAIEELLAAPSLLPSFS